MYVGAMRIERSILALLMVLDQDEVKDDQGLKVDSPIPMYYIIESKKGFVTTNPTNG